MKKKIILYSLILSMVCIMATPITTYSAKHTHTGTVKITSSVERNGYIVVKWKKSKSCKGYCVHVQCGNKILACHCYGKTITTARIKETVTLKKKLDKCGNWKTVVYCSSTGPSGANGGRGG